MIQEGANFGDVVSADVVLSGLYRECARKHRGLVEWAGVFLDKR